MVYVVKENHSLKKFIIILVALSALVLGMGVKHLFKRDFTTLDGQAYQWADKQGKWTAVNYFAEWCAPCLREIPELNHFYMQDNPSIRLFAVSFDKLSDDQLAELKQRYAIQFPLINDVNSLPWQQPPSSLPTTYILDPNGVLIKQIKGEVSGEKLEKQIERLKHITQR